MKKSKSVPATLVAALAGVAATGCGSGGYDQCVDAYGRVVNDGFCRSGGGYGGTIYRYRHVSSGGFGGSSSSGGFFGG